MFFTRFMLIAASLMGFASCQNETPKAPVAALLVKEEAEELKQCVRDSICVEVKAVLPQLEGGSNPAAIKAINDSLKASIVGSNHLQFPLRQALDSTMAQLFGDLKQQVADAGDLGFTMGYSDEASGKIIYTAPKVVTAEFTYSSFTGGAHGMYGTTLATYDLSTGKEFKLTDLVNDTTALRPLLEKKILTQQHVVENGITALKDMLFEPEKPLALPMNACVVKEGLRFVYNPYEIMAYAFGQSDLLLTWDELGKLADRTKWQ
jgi:Deacetylase PdaC